MTAVDTDIDTPLGCSLDRLDRALNIDAPGVEYLAPEDSVVARPMIELRHDLDTDDGQCGDDCWCTEDEWWLKADAASWPTPGYRHNLVWATEHRWQISLSFRPFYEINP